MISFLLNIRQSVRFLLVVIYVGCIAALSLLPMSDFPKVHVFHGIDKVVHFIMYFIFSLLLSWTLKSELKYLRFILVALITISWGVFMEFMQLDMHLGRSFSFYDITANSIGVIFGIVIFYFLSRKYFPD